MQWLSSVLLAVQVISSLSIIVLVLLQQGKGADMGSSFGGGSAGSLFGASGAANFLSRTTKWAAIIFFISTGGLAWVGHHPAERNKVNEGVMQNYQSPEVPSTGSAVPTIPSAPAVPGAQPAPAVPAAPSTSSAPAAGSATPSAPATSSSAPAAASGATQSAPATPAQSAAPAKPAG